MRRTVRERGTRMNRKQREQVSAPLDPELLDIVRHVAELAKKKLPAVG